MLYEVITNIVASQGAWKQANELCFLLNNLTEELIDYNQLVADGNTDISTVGQVLEQYALLLTEKNMLDFSSIQTEAYWLLKNNQGILDEIYEQVKYIMIDEYQDTNRITSYNVCYTKLLRRPGWSVARAVGTDAGRPDLH